MAKGKDRDRRREARWRRIIGEYERSGLSIRQFCRKSKLQESAFYFWRRELQRRQPEQEQSPQADPPAAPTFVPVRIGPQGIAAPAGHVEIVLSSGHRLHVAAPVDRQALADVLAVLEAQRC